MNDFHPKLARQGIFKGVYLKPLVARLWRLESMHVDGRTAPPDVRWRACKFGMCSVAHVYRQAIVVSLWPTETIEGAAETILHELVHCSLPVHEGHSEWFCRRLIACAREAFGIELDTAALLALPATQGCVAYTIDLKIREAMASAGIGVRLCENVETRFVPPPVEDPAAVEARLKAARAEGQAKATAAREAHARAKLTEWESRLARTKRVAMKWRAKVRYYDRRQLAAKKKGSTP